LLAQALFDIVKERSARKTVAQENFKNNFKLYLQNKDWVRLPSLFTRAHPFRIWFD